MAEALWLQLAGVDYSAAEDRRAISALASPGVVNGLTISIVSGLQVKILAGTGIIDDGAGGCYVAYTTSDTTLTMPTNATTNIYLVVNTTTAAVTVTSGATPTAGTYLSLGSATSTAGVNSVVNTTVKAQPPGVKDAFLKLTGGTVAGEVNATRLVVPGLFGVGGTDLVPNAPKGVRLGGTNPQARHHMHSSLLPATASLNTINNTPSGGDAVYEVIHWNLQTADGSANYTDYAQIPQTGTDWALWPGPTSGIYICTGYVNWAAKAGGSRNIRLEVWNRNGAAADTISYATYAQEVQPQANANFTNAFAFTFIMNDPATQYARVAAFQNSGAGLALTSGRVWFDLLSAR